MSRTLTDKYTKEQVSSAIDGSDSIRQVLTNLGMSVNNGSYQSIRSLANFYHLELPKYSPSDRKNIESLVFRNKIPNDEFFVQGVTRNGNSLKKRMVEDFHIPYVCSMDGCPSPEPMWDGKPLTLQLDHKDGDRFNNKLSNLRLLCPNCHSQTETYGNNKKSLAEPRYNYCSCGKRIGKKSETCLSCVPRKEIHKQNNRYPPVDELVAMIRESSFSHVSRTIGVSDNAIRKFLRNRGINPKEITPFPKHRKHELT